MGALVHSPLGLRSMKAFCLLRVLPHSAGWIEWVRSCAGADWFLFVRVGDPTSARAGGCRSLLRCIAPLLPDPDKLWQRPGCTGRMIPTLHDLSEG